MRGKTGSIRQAALSTDDFNAAERHGKRLDVMGPARRVRDVEPLVYGSLNLAEAHAEHMKGVAQQGKTKALHMMVQFPTDLPDADNEQTQKAMLRHAVKFANEYHGGDAVFAARLDRDEKGRHTVDVFLMPRYDFTYKDGRTQKRAAVSKFSKQHAQERSAALIGPDEPKLDPQGPTVQGRALQAAWYEYLHDDCRLKWVQPPDRKVRRTKDRLEPEEFGLRRDQEAFALKQIEDEQQAKDDRQAIILAARALERKEKAISDRELALLARESEMTKKANILIAARLAEGKSVPVDLEKLVERNDGRQRRGIERVR